MHSYKEVAGELKKNPEQWAAYESPGNCVILAGPGSGKTKILTIKMARMLTEDVRRPAGIACITYNTECARELQRRLATLGIFESANVFIGTAHSFSLKNVLYPFAHLSDLSLPKQFTVASSNDVEKLFSEALKSTIGNENPSRYKARFDRYRRTYLERASKEFLSTDSDLAQLVQAYEARLIAANFIDFDGMILWGLNLIEKHDWARKALRARFPIIVVDEYQDLGLPLHRMVLSLCKKAGVRLLAVGDPDQSIYGFVGSQPNLLLDLAKSDWVLPINLKFNYRCGKKIVAASITALGENREYESKVAHQGAIDFYECPEGIDQQAEVIVEGIIPDVIKRFKGLTLGQIAVLYADRNDGTVIAKAADKISMKYIRIDAGAAYRRTPLTRWLEDCAAWCATGWTSKKTSLSALIKKWLSFNSYIKGSLAKLELRKQFIGFLFSHRNPDLLLRTWLSDFYETCLSETLKSQPIMKDELETYNMLYRATEEKCALEKFSLAAFSGQGGSPVHLNLITLHSVKGLEFDVIIMMGMDQGKVPRWSASTSEEILEARRLFYVGLTRAKHQIYITYSGFTEDQYGNRRKNGPSAFVIELQNKIAAEKILD